MGAIFARVAKEPVSKPILPLYSLEWFGQQAKDQRSQLGIAGFAIDRSSETWPRARPLSRDLLPLLEVSFRLEPIVQISSVYATAFQMQFICSVADILRAGGV
jgi:hypothetical protein